MKKRLIGLLLILSLLLTACTATDPDNLFEIEPDNTAAPTSENKEDTTVSIPEDTQSDILDIMYYTGAYQYGNMQQGSDWFLLYNNEVVFKPSRYTKNGSFKSRLFSYDLIKGEVHSFCQDATCTHEACANSPLTRGIIEVYNGKIYGLNDENFVTEATQSGAKVVVDSPVYFQFFHHDDKLYVRTHDSSLVMFEKGKKEPQIVVEEYVASNGVVFGDYLYASGYLCVVRVDLTAENPEVEEIVPNAFGRVDGQYIYYADITNYHLYRCDLDGSNAQLILDRPVLPASMNFDDDYFYFRLMKEMDYTLPVVTSFASMEEQQQYMEEWAQYNKEQLYGSSDCYDLFRFPKENPTKIEKIATLPHAIYNVYTVPGTGKIFVSTPHEEGESYEHFYVMGTDGSNPTKLVIPDY